MPKIIVAAWTEINILRFLKLYQTYSVLWNVDHTGYFDSSQRFSALDEISKSLNLIGIDAEQCAKLIKFLKHFYLEKKRISEREIKTLPLWFPVLEKIVVDVKNITKRSEKVENTSSNKNQNNELSHCFCTEDCSSDKPSYGCKSEKHGTLFDFEGKSPIDLSNDRTCELQLAKINDIWINDKKFGQKCADSITDLNYGRKCKDNFLSLDYEESSSNNKKILYRKCLKSVTSSSWDCESGDNSALFNLESYNSDLTSVECCASQPVKMNGILISDKRVDRKSVGLIPNYVLNEFENQINNVEPRKHVFSSGSKSPRSRRKLLIL